MLGNPNRMLQQGNKPPRRHWYATPGFIDIKLSHIIEGALALALFCAAIAQVSVYLRQAHIMNRQLSVMQRQLTDAEIQEAASITIRNLTVNGFPDDTVLSYDVLNTGRTRANQVTTDQGYMTFPAQEEMSILANKQFFGGRDYPSVWGITIDPSDPPRHITYHFGTVPKYPEIHPEERRKLKEGIKSGSVAIAFNVAGTYSDVFGRTQHVVDCIIFDGGFGESERNGGKLANAPPAFEPCLGQQNHHY